MSLFSLFRRGTAPVARERLQVLLAHERIARGKADLLNVLREEILAVIARHVLFEPIKFGSKWIEANRYQRWKLTLKSRAG